MGKTDYLGSFELNFKREEDFKAFGYEYAKCYLNMSLNGHIEPPVKTGPKRYKVDFAIVLIL